MFDEDRAALERAKSGDREAFGDLVGKYQDSIVNLILRLVGNYDIAVELAQESFLKAYRGLSKFRLKSSFFTWLYRIATNVALSHRRSEKVRSQAREFTMEEEQLERLEEKGNPGSNPAQTLEEKERQVIIQQALITLEASLRQAVVLRDAEGLSYEEISQVLELPLGTVKSRIHRGRVQLREKLMGYLDEL